MSKDLKMMDDSPKSITPAPALERVARGNLCAGCGGCTLVAPEAITMEMTAPGFLRPHQTATLTAVQNAQIAQICPGLGQTIDPAGRRDDPLWGPYEEIWTGHATDPDIRYASSSGGGLSAVATHLLEIGAVDGILQTAAHPDVPVANITVISTNREEILKAAGSRYAPSAPLAGLSALLETSTARYAFVGKPCDVAALRALSEVDPRITPRIPVVLSFFCAGVPSQTGAQGILSALDTNLENTTHFRYRGNGWPGRATAILKDGSERSMSYHESWGKILSKHTQLRCKLCADGTGTAADLVFADAWESDADGYPLFEERPGTSLIIARTAKGRSLLEDARSAGALKTTPFDVAALAAIQPGQVNRRTAVLARLAGLWCLVRPAPHYKGLQLRAAARMARPKTLLHNFLGMIRRGLQHRT